MYFSDWKLHKDAKIGTWLLWEYNMDKMDTPYVDKLFKKCL